MKKFLTVLFTLAVACSLSLPVFAQDTGGSTDKGTTTKTEGKKAHKGGKKGHKGGKKSKKGSTDTGTTPPPK
jgi:hypothetical protein